MPINLSADVVAGLVDAWFPCDCRCKLCVMCFRWR